MKLRYYQEEAIAALLTFRQKHPGGNPLIALPTGAGKSVVIAGFLATAFAMAADQRWLMLTHRKTLIEQNKKALLRVWPHAPVGVYSAGLNSRESHQPIVFAGIQSVYKKAALFGHVDGVIIDEAHLVGDSASSMYQTFLGALAQVNPDLYGIGTTATWWRASGPLTDGDIFTHIAYDRTQRNAFMQLVEDGFLCKLSTYCTKAQIKTEGVKITGGDFNEKALEAAVLADFPNVEACVQETIAAGENRRAWFVFTVSIAHAEAIAELLTNHGIAAAAYHSELESDANDQALKDFAAGRLRALVNVNCLTTGIDVPQIDLIAVMRPTRSSVLWVQMLGRGTRPAEGKEDCLVLDFGHCAEVLGPINDPVIPRKKRPVEDCPTCPGWKRQRNEDGQPKHAFCPDCGKQFCAPMRECPECGYYNYFGARTCEHCGFEFERVPDIKDTPSQAAVMAEAHAPAVVEAVAEVNSVDYTLHEKNGRQSLVVIYTCGLQEIRRWINFEHPEGSYPRLLAYRFWKAHTKGTPYAAMAPPETAAVALAIATNGAFRVPRTIKVIKEGRFLNVTSEQF